MENGRKGKQEDNQLKQGVATGPGGPRRPGERLGRCWSACGCKRDRRQGQFQEFGREKMKAWSFPLLWAEQGWGEQSRKHGLGRVKCQEPRAIPWEVSGDYAGLEFRGGAGLEAAFWGVSL